MVDDADTATSLDDNPDVKTTDDSASISSMRTAYPTVVAPTIPLDMMRCTKCELLVYKCVIPNQCAHKYCAGCYAGLRDTNPFRGYRRCSLCGARNSDWLYSPDYDKIVEEIVSIHPQVGRSDDDKQRLEILEYRALRSHFLRQFSSASDPVQLSHSFSSSTYDDSDLEGVEEQLEALDLNDGEVIQMGDWESSQTSRSRSITNAGMGDNQVSSSQSPDNSSEDVATSSNQNASQNSIEVSESSFTDSAQEQSSSMETNYRIPQPDRSDIEVQRRNSRYHSKIFAQYYPKLERFFELCTKFEGSIEESRESSASASVSTVPESVSTAYDISSADAYTSLLSSEDE